MKQKSGYCNQCLRNVPHLFRMRSGLLKLSNKCTFGLLHAMGFGSWFCAGCDRQVFFLPKYRKGVSDFVEVEEDLRHSRRKSKDSSSNQLGGVANQEELIDPSLIDIHDSHEPIGNVLKSDESLLVRKARASRYSAKFRESVVQRVLSGKATITQIRKELKLSERDILDWLAQSNREKENQIVDLSHQLSEIKKLGWNGPIEPQPESDRNDHVRIDQDASIIDGRVNPK